MLDIRELQQPGQLEEAIENKRVQLLVAPRVLRLTGRWDLVSPDLYALTAMDLQQLHLHVDMVWYNLRGVFEQGLDAVQATGHAVVQVGSLELWLIHTSTRHEEDKQLDTLTLTTPL